jgi:hypothetical protein
MEVQLPMRATSATEAQADKMLAKDVLVNNFMFPLHITLPVFPPMLSSLPWGRAFPYSPAMKLLPTLALLCLAAGLLAEDAPKEIVLFDGKSLADWQNVDVGGSASVELRDGQMIIGTGDSITGAIYKKADKLPLTNYEITLEAMRVDGSDFFCGLTFPVGSLKTCATLILGGWGGAVTGISSIDGADASENATGHYLKLDDKKWYKIKLRVTPDNLSVWIDDKKEVDQDIKGRKVGLRPGPIEEYAPLSLTTYQTTAAIKNVKLTPLPEKK